mgnify:FL=1
MSENAKKLKEEKKLGNLRERLKEVKGQASDFEIKKLKDSIQESMERIKEFNRSFGLSKSPRGGIGSLNKRELEALKASPIQIQKKSQSQNNGVISFEELEKNQQKKEPKILKVAKGGAIRKGDSEAVQKYKDGGEVKKKKSKLAGRLAQRGYGKARK